VVDVAVNLDDQATVAPDEVDLDPLYSRVRLGPRDAVGIAELEEALLELAAGRGGAVAP
jgi:hypothetical protein